MRNGIAAAFMEGMAAAQAFQTHPDAPRGSVHFDGFAHVVGAGWVEAAGGGEQRGDQAFVPGEEPGEEEDEWLPDPRLAH